MGPEIKETMHKGTEASIGCSLGKSSFYGPPGPWCFNGYMLKQVNADSETEAVNGENFAVPGECCGRPVQNESCCFWSSFSPNFLKEMHSHSRPFDGSLYPAKHGQYYPAYWFQHVPMQMLSQSYPPEYALQDFQYFVVIDFEATCDKEKNPHPQEIIEFPSVLVNSRTGQLEDCFQKYVRPTHNKRLSEFCKELTGIQQSQVDEGVSLSEVLLMHDRWLEDKGIKQTNFAVVTWSNWDCRVMLESECRFKRIRKPPYFNRWINLKVPFCEAFGAVRCNLKEAVELSGLTWEGRAHCGLDDAKNTARLLSLLMCHGFKLSITNSLLWQSADHPHVMQRQVPSPPECGIAYHPLKWKTPYHLFPYQTTQIAKPINSQVCCYCGVTSIKFRISGPKHESFFFGCGNWTANCGPRCSFSSWVAGSESAESG